MNVVHLSQSLRGERPVCKLIKGINQWNVCTVSIYKLNSISVLIGNSFKYNFRSIKKYTKSIHPLQKIVVYVPNEFLVRHLYKKTICF